MVQKLEPRTPSWSHEGRFEIQLSSSRAECSPDIVLVDGCKIVGQATDSISQADGGLKICVRGQCYFVPYAHIIHATTLGKNRRLIWNGNRNF